MTPERMLTPESVTFPHLLPVRSTRKPVLSAANAARISATISDLLNAGVKVACC